MYTEILTKRQAELFPFIGSFSKDFYLAGGTAIALMIGHRRSIDFDLFTSKTINSLTIKGKFKANNIHYTVLQEAYDQVHFLVDEVKLTFFSFPYEVPVIRKPGSSIHIPDLLTLAAMKALALGGRAKWKDYVDLYYILNYHHTMSEVEGKAAELFPEAFSAKLFRQQLVYFKDIDYSEKVFYVDAGPDDEEIRNFLANQATRLI
jgi:hypothetical protein